MPQYLSNLLFIKENNKYSLRSRHLMVWYLKILLVGLKSHWVIIRSKHMNEWMNEWMCIYIPHISRCLMAVYNSYYWVRSNVSLWRRLWQPLSVHIWSHSPTQPMHEMWDRPPPHRELMYFPLVRKVFAVFYCLSSPLEYYTPTTCPLVIHHYACMLYIQYCTQRALSISRK